MDILSDGVVLSFNGLMLDKMPKNIMVGHYDVGLVILSYVIAVLASYVALSFVGRLRLEKNQRAKIYWLAGGSFAMGSGIWSMHFIGMLAFIMAEPMQYDLSWTCASLFISVLVSVMALVILQKKSTFLRLSLGGLIMGLGIAAMHYAGMEAMTASVDVYYLPRLFFLSIMIAVIAAQLALWLMDQSIQGSEQRQLLLKILSSLVMGIAICGMHYIGMAGAIFTSKSTPVLSYENIDPAYLAFFIGGITVLVISQALTASSYYRQMVLAVENEKEFLNAMLNNLDDGIIACDAERKITVFNNMLKQFVDFNKKNQSIDCLPSLFSLYTMDNHEVSRDHFPLYRVLKGERIRGLQFLMRFKNNIVREVIIDGQPIINADGRKLGAVIVIHDITELKRTEKLKDEFVSIVSHELRTPLTSIRGALGLLASGVMGEFPEKAKKLLDIANSNCDRLLLLINDILDIEKIEAGKMNFQLKLIELNPLIHEAIEANQMYAEKYSLKIKLIAEEESVKVLVDPDRLMQVFANLISNACKFSPEGDEICITVKTKMEKVRISISDNGPGIPIEFQSRLFKKFSQADSSDTRGKGGTGLGLNISRTIIEKFGGTLNFTSQPKQGTTFYFDLPIADEMSSKIEEAPVTQLKGNKGRLLICEDDEDQSSYVKMLLESNGYVVDVANTVADAKKQLSMHEYQAILLDLILPDQDGIAFIRELRGAKKTSELYIIVISVIAPTGRALLDKDIFTLVDWLDKPVDLNLLLASLKKVQRIDYA